MKFTSTLSFLLASVILPTAQADLIRGAEKEGKSDFKAKVIHRAEKEGKSDMKGKSLFGRLAKDQGSDTSSLLSVNGKDRGLKPGSSCPAFLNVAKGQNAQLYFECGWDLPQEFKGAVGPVSSAYCSIFDWDDDLVGEFVGKAAYFNPDAGIYVAQLDGTLAIEGVIGVSISGLFVFDGPASYSDIRLGSSYNFGSTSKETCMSKYQVVNVLDGEFLELSGWFAVELWGPKVY